MFDKFQDYMYYLLYGPLKRVTKLKNQFYLLFKVMGKVFDQTKQDIFRVREESMIISASEKLLDEHGRDRGMQKLKGESIESFRTRLSMKNIIAEKAGTNEGILIALKSLGYKHVNIIPTFRFMDDTERWAEFHVVIPEEDIDLNKQFDNTKIIVKSVKPASALPNYAFSLEINNNTKNSQESKVINILEFKAINYIDVSQTVKFDIENINVITAKTVKEINLWVLDGTYSLNGEKLLNAERIEEVL